jgi:hypothetical protein
VNWHYWFQNSMLLLAGLGGLANLYAAFRQRPKQIEMQKKQAGED